MVLLTQMGLDTTGRLYDDIIRLLFLHAHREASPLAKELCKLPEESDHFRFLRAPCFANFSSTITCVPKNGNSDGLVFQKWE